MINRIKQKLNKDFTILPNEVFNGNLTAKAIGIFAYLCSKDDDWVFYQTEIEQHFKMGITAVSTALKELEDNGLLLRYRERKSGKLGNMVYILFPNEDDYNYIGKTYIGKSNIGKSCIGKSKANNRDNTNREEKKRDNTNREENNKQKEKPKSETLPPKTKSKTLQEAEEVASYLLNKILELNPDFKDNNSIAKWSIDIDRAIRLDKRTKQQLLDVIDYIYSAKGKFWISNILCGAKLREKFNTLNTQRLATVKYSQPKLTPYTDLSNVDYGDVENTAF